MEGAKESGVSIPYIGGKKSKKMMPINFALLLWPPKKACGFGPVWAILETVFQFFWAKKGLNGPKSHR